MATKPFSIRSVKMKALNRVMNFQKKQMIDNTNTRREDNFKNYVNEIKQTATQPLEWRYGNKGWSGKKKNLITDVDDELDRLIEQMLRDD